MAFLISLGAPAAYADVQRCNPTGGDALIASICVGQSGSQVSSLATLVGSGTASILVSTQICSASGTNCSNLTVKGWPNETLSESGRSYWNLPPSTASTGHLYRGCVFITPSGYPTVGGCSPTITN